MFSQVMLNNDILEVRLKVIQLKSLKAGQLLAIDILFNEKKDMILIAKTIYEKSILFYSVLI